MKIRNIAILALLTMAAAGSASAIVPSQNTAADLHVSSTGGNISTHLTNSGTATLHGSVSNQFEADRAEAAALSIIGVNRVVNLLSISNNERTAIAHR